MQAGLITTPQIVATTTAGALACMRWMPIGACFSLRCSWSGCRVRTSLKVGHYNPDFVVGVYTAPGGNPWAEIRATLGLAQKAAATGLLGALLPVPLGSAGNRTEGTQPRPFLPYFQSALEALAWRQEVPEIFYPASWVPGLREVGTWPLQTWGGLYPRTGWTTRAEEPKAAAVNAQRAGDIVTRGASPMTTCRSRALPTCTAARKPCVLNSSRGIGSWRR